MNVEHHSFLTSMVNNLSLVITDSGYADIDKEWNEEHLRTPFTRLYYIESGSGVLETKLRNVDLDPNKIYLIPSGFSFNTRCDSVMSKLYFHIILKDLRGLDLFGDCHQILSLPSDPQRINELCQLYTGNDLNSASRLKSELFYDCSHFLSLAGISAQPSVPPLLQQVYRLAQNPITAQNTVRNLAARLNLSESTLSKTFKKMSGMTLDRYLNTLLLDRACQLLLVSYMSIGEIASSLAFCDAYYFSRYFKKNMGMTPTCYRKLRINDSINYPYPEHPL